MHIKHQQFFLVMLQFGMLRDKTLYFFIQLVGIYVFRLTLYFANTKSFVKFIHEDNVDLVSALFVPKVDYVGIFSAFLGLLTEITFEHQSRKC